LGLLGFRTTIGVSRTTKSARMGRIRKSFRLWNRRRAEGHSAVEFALIAPVFFMLLMGIVETGMVFFASSTLENGMEVAARMIRTGQVQSGSMSQTAFRQVVCDNINTFMSCDSSKLHIDVRAYTNFASSSYPEPIDENGNLNSNLDNFTPGSSCQVVLVRAFYEWRLFTPGFAQYYANLGNNKRLLSASVAFRNEPYGVTPC
jgi:Flp pilus assembly protein TadG